MAHAHEHHHHGENYFLDQVATVAVAGLIAGIGFLAWKTGLFREYNILTDLFIIWVLLGSLVLGALVVVRGLTLWKQAGSRHAHGHDHHHHHHDHGHHHHHHEHGEHCHHEHALGESCGHDHSHSHDPAHGHGHHHHHEHEHAHGHEHHHHHDHEHGHHHHHHHHEGAVDDHGHSHEFAPWRYAVLLVPLLLSGLLLYYRFAGLDMTYSGDRIFQNAGEIAKIEGGAAELKATSADKGQKVLTPGLKELVEAGANEGRRDYWEGQLAELKGLFRPVGDREFTVLRLKMTCCASDAVPVNVQIFAPESLSRYGLEPRKGVSVIGQVQFRKVQDRDQYVPILVAKEIKRTELGNDIFDRD